jgi:hypothetical protein
MYSTKCRPTQKYFLPSKRQLLHTSGVSIQGFSRGSEIADWSMHSSTARSRFPQITLYERNGACTCQTAHYVQVRVICRWSLESSKTKYRDFQPKRMDCPTPFYSSGGYTITPSSLILTFKKPYFLFI